MSKLITRFLTEEAGSNALEYGLIVALVSLAIVAGSTAAGNALNDMFNAVATKLSQTATTV
jgi:pilus assembly protein Flp/PilA